jgi:glutamyl-tRNA synthetase
MKEIAQAVRLALTGRTASPGLFEIMEILGPEEVHRRLQAALDACN